MTTSRFVQNTFFPCSRAGSLVACDRRGGLSETRQAPRRAQYWKFTAGKILGCNIPKDSGKYKGLRTNHKSAIFSESSFLPFAWLASIFFPFFANHPFTCFLASSLPFSLIRASHNLAMTNVPFPSPRTHMPTLMSSPTS